jgi:hypothetical protein
VFSRANKRVQFGYGLNYIIDVEHAIIVDVEATPARTYDEVASTMTMIEVKSLRENMPLGGRDDPHCVGRAGVDCDRPH